MEEESSALAEHEEGAESIVSQPSSSSRLKSCCLAGLTNIRIPRVQQNIVVEPRPSNMKTAQRWLLTIFAVTSCLVILILLTSVSLRKGKLSITLDLDELTERSKCPACFGVNLCPQMISGKIELNDWTKYSISKLVNSKNIFYATWYNRGKEHKLVLKKLAHDHELDQLDKNICERHGVQNQCDVKDSVRVLIDKYSHTTEARPDEPILNGETIGKVTDVLLCPSHDKMDYLIEAVTKKSRGPHRNTILAHFLTMILINPEPILLMSFPAEDGWPFPIYHGACGRLVAEEYCGPRLTTFYHDSFKVRASIARQLLQIATHLSTKNTKFVLYLTDISPDNFAVNEDNYDVKVIDLENIVVVDRGQLASLNDNSKVYESEPIKCDKGNSENECFSFSVDDLCARSITDHNYFAICAGLLSSDALAREFPLGLLHSIPPEVKNSHKYSKIEEYLESCRKPGPKLNRIDAAKNLLQVLDLYVKDSS